MFSHKTKNSSNTIDMCEGPIFPILLKVTIPLILIGLLQVLFNAADIMVVGKFGSEQSVAAVSSASPIVALLVNIFMGISVGTNVVCARLFGEGNKTQMEKAVHTSIFISLVIGIFLTLIGFFSAETLLKFLDTPESVIPLSAKYLRIYFLGMVPIIVYNFAAAILRAVGDTKRPLYFLTIAGVVNILLNLLLVIVFKLDVAGVAIATTASNIISAICCVGVLVKATDSTHLDLKKLRVDFHLLKEIIRIGLPAGLQSSFFSVSNAIIRAATNSICAGLSVTSAEALLAGNGACSSIESFLFTMLGSIHQAVVAFTGQNYGRRDYKRIVKCQLCSVLFVLLFGGTVCTVMSFFSDKLLLLYISSEEAIAYGVLQFSLVGALSFLNGISDVFVGCMRGCGYSFLSMMSSLICICGLRIVWILTVFQIPEYHTYRTLLTCYPISYCISIVVQGMLMFFVLKKVKKKLLPQL